MSVLTSVVEGIDVASALSPQSQAQSSNSIETHSATVNGVEISYLQSGQGSETPVVLLHGYTETSHMWRPLITKLADRRIVIAPDLRGAGSSEKPQGGYDSQRRCVAEHSYGSRVARDTAAMIHLCRVPGTSQSVGLSPDLIKTPCDFRMSRAIFRGVQIDGT